MPLTAPPTIPLITDPSTFAVRAQDWVVWQADELYPFITETSAILALSTTTTSVTSNTVGTGSKSFTVETGKGFAAGQSLSIAYTTTPTNRMFAVVTSYNSGTGALVVNVQAIEGSGTFAAWSIALAFNGVIGAGQIPDGLITPVKLSSGAPNWDANGVFVGGTASLDLSLTGTGQYPEFGTYITGETVGLATAKYSNDGAPSAIYLVKTRGASIGLKTIVQNNDVIGRFIFRTADGSNYINAGHIECAVDGIPAVNDMPARLSFFTTPDGSAIPTEKFRIGNNGSFSSVIPAGSTLYPEFKCRAWVNFNGTGTVVIRASGNVSSITDNGVGLYTVNLTTAMPDVNYSVSGASQAGGNAITVSLDGASTNPTALTTASFPIHVRQGASAVDSSTVCVSVFR